MHGAVRLGRGMCRICVRIREDALSKMVIGESRDGVGAGDHDLVYEWGNPHTMLTWHQQALLLVMRGLIKDTRAGERGTAGEGDLSFTPDSEPEAEPTPS